ncbi:hypothetical protein ACFE04_005764 [Oxalis oulophora]
MQSSSSPDKPTASCHQCRQRKCVDVIVSCTVIKETKGACPLKFCDKCLLNRYGEQKDVVSLLDDWRCPKCRGICNCSTCRKQQGQKPTGHMGNRVRKSGFTNVSDLLAVKNPEYLENFVEKEESIAELDEVNGTSLTKCKRKRKLNVEVINTEPELEMPKGTSIATIAGVELNPEEIGEALQLIEFCAAFGEVLGLEKGHAESIIQELAHGRRRKCGQDSSVLVQIHIQLLTMIHNDMGIKSPSLSDGTDKNSWLQALAELASESQNFPSNWFDKGTAGYEELNVCEKLKLLNFLCDEALSTSELRLCIAKKHVKFNESEKDVRSKISAAREKVKELEKKLKIELTQALNDQNGASDIADENQTGIDQLKVEVDRARAERLEAEGAQQSKGTQRSDALRTEPILLDDNGCVFWKLKGYSEEPALLVQDFGAWDSFAPHEKWSAYSEEQKQDILKYLSFSSDYLRYLCFTTFPFAAKKGLLLQWLWTHRRLKAARSYWNDSQQ